MNSLSDYGMIDQLYEASQAGVKIKLIVRGICCLKPQVEGLSENIEVISVVDKFLEHSRLYIFENDGLPKVFISSADLMTRNLDHRVEVTCPIYHESIKNELIETFNLCWSENVKARDMAQQDTNAYRAVPSKSAKHRSQFKTYDYYLNASKNA